MNVDAVVDDIFAELDAGAAAGIVPRPWEFYEKFLSDFAVPPCPEFEVEEPLVECSCGADALPNLCGRLEGQVVECGRRCDRLHVPRRIVADFSFEAQFVESGRSSGRAAVGSGAVRWADVEDEEDDGREDAPPEMMQLGSDGEELARRLVKSSRAFAQAWPALPRDLGICLCQLIE